MRTIFKHTICALLLLTATFTAHAQSAFKVPPYQKFTLPNGLTVYLMEQHEIPLISVSAVLPAGAIYDGDKHGLASLTAAGLQYGTKSFTKNQIEEELDFVGADLNSYATKEYASLSAKFAAKNTDKVLAIVSEVLTAPSFPAAEFDKEKERVLARLDQAKQSPRQVINAYWDNFIYGSHVYSNSTSGSPATVGKLTAADLKAFYSNNYIPQRSAIAVVGDFKAADMKQKLTKYFGKWNNKGAAQISVPTTVTAPTEARVLLVNKDDARETTFLIGGLGIKRDNPDYVAIDVVNTLFGARFTSMLNDELRVNSGLTYGARSSFNPLKNSGTFYISTFTATKTTEAAIDKALEVLNRLHEKGLDEKSLTSAKNYVKGLFPPKYETSGQLADLLTQMFWYGFNESYINDFQANVDKLDLARSKEIIAKYFPKDKLQFVLVGKSADIKKIAEKYGKVTEKQIKADGF
ncbi:insulinase family protein [Mucilaginibacter sp. JRF]|uniref:M16 family metallopeptidase n=1 Tax=Mucilaginibacter sp. JRF TaxID=2780088 RepID=UPI00187F4A0E|nr:pitrilysin family protein [Mucilaginibacter sp. JRF]MBE9586832.1 insulinase family protein [Mucilaginibacter sp. JRF]